MATKITGTEGVDLIKDGTVKQADLAANVAGNGPAFSATDGTFVFTVSGGSEVILNWDTVDYNLGGYFNPTTGRFTPLIAGYYMVFASVRPNATNLDGGSCNIWRNATKLYGSALRTAPLSAIPEFSTSALVYLNGSTDYVRCAGGASGSADFVSTASTFSAVLVRAA